MTDLTVASPFIKIWMRYILPLSCLFGTVNSFGLSPSERERSIRQNIPSRDYSIMSRPMDMVEVDLSVHLLMVSDLNTKKEILSMIGRVKTKWNDPALTWYPMQHHNVTFVLLERKQLWSPEIIIDNAAGDVKPIGDSRREDIVRLEYSGTVQWDVSINFQTYCDIDVTFYPFDTQRCTIDFGEWSYTNKEINFTTVAKGIELGPYKGNGEWDIIGTFAYPQKVGTDLQYTQLHFGLVLKRRSLYYILNIIVPLVLISILCVISFLIPLDAGEKVTYSITVLLSLAVLLSVIGGDMPSTSKHVSVLDVYLVTVMIVGTVTCMTTIGILRLYHRNDHEFPIPVWLQKFVSSFSPLLSRGSSSIVGQHGSPEHMTETGWTRPNIADDLHGQLECWGEETVGSDYHSRRRSESRVFQTTRMGVRRKRSMKQENSRDGGQTRRPDSWKGVARAVDRFCFRLTLFIVILTNLMMMIVLGAFS